MDKHREKIRWACRRGMLELDLFLVPFFEKGYDSLTPDEQYHFQILLQEPDPVLLAYCMGNQESQTPELKNIIEKIRQFKAQSYSDRFL